MIKKTFAVMAIAAIAVVAGWSYQQSNSEVTLSDLASENLEALADKRPNADPCGGPKEGGICMSNNTVNCRDLSGCQ